MQFILAACLGLPVVLLSSLIHFTSSPVSLCKVSAITLSLTAVSIPLRYKFHFFVGDSVFFDPPPKDSFGSFFRALSLSSEFSKYMDTPPRANAKAAQTVISLPELNILIQV